MICGIAYSHTQSLDYYYNGSLADQARRERDRELQDLTYELNRLEKIHFISRTDEEDKRIEEIYSLVCK